MVFSSLMFIFYFLPLTLMVYYIVPKNLRNVCLLIISLIFYGWGEPIYIGIMLFSFIVDYTHGLLIEKYRDNNRRTKAILLSSILINLGLLAFFKYYDFIIININLIIGTNIRALNLPLPIGISFYTFQTMSYTIDVYRMEVPAQKKLVNLATYVTLFPQLIAGPIVRYKTVEKELNNRRENIDQFAEGVSRFIVGLGKKVLLANNIGMLWNDIQKISINEISILTAWLGIIAFSFQIYFDFSGYSDMAIGLGKMFGFNFLENFNYPYISRSVTEFWRRWHISLSTWFKDYLYIPLGGNKVSRKYVYLNLLIVWSLTGIWHGASWNYLMWGLYFGILIIIEKVILLKLLDKVWNSIRHLYTIILLCIGWTLFVFENLFEGMNYLKVMFGLRESNFIDNTFKYYFSNYIIVLIVLIIASTPIIKNKHHLLRDRLKGLKRILYENVIVNVTLLFILVLSTAYLVNSSFNPFLYFRF